MTNVKRSPQIRFFVLTLILAATWLTGCVKPSINFGSTFINNNTTNIVVVDTFSALMSTVYYDSFATSATGRMLIGRYQDNSFGLISSRTYYQLAPPRVIPNITYQAGYDSLVLITRLDRYYYGDSSQAQEYVVNQLKTNLEYPGNQNAFYNNDSIPVESSPLGSATVFINPTARYTSQLQYDSLKIRLSDPLGQNLFRMIQNSSDTITNTNTFLGYFKGVAVSPGPGSLGAVFGFKDTVVMRLYYHEPGVVTTPRYTDFIIWNRALQFNQISSDRSGTPLQGLASAVSPVPGVPVEISSSSTGNAVYVQSGTALRAKIKFPNLWELLQRQDFVSILKAELDLSPLSGSYSPEISLPQQLQLYTTDATNQPLFPVAAAGGNYGNFKVDYIYNANTKYVFDITTFIKSQINAGAEIANRNGLMVLIPPPLENTVLNRAIFPDNNNPNKNARVVLKIYYASYY